MDILMKFVSAPLFFIFTAYSKVACFVDKSDRILEGNHTETTYMTVEKCVEICSLEGDYFAGVELASHCFCGKHLKQYSHVAETECSSPCQGDQSQKCGGYWTTNVNYLGCYEDKSDRILEDELTFNSTMTTKMCIQTCQNKGKRFALTECSSYCICGNHLRAYTKKPESDCDYVCSGNANEKCGGSWRGSLYLINYNAVNRNVYTRSFFISGYKHTYV